MKTFGFALALGASCAATPLYASIIPFQVVEPHPALLHRVVDDYTGVPKHRGGGRKSRNAASKAVEPGVPSMKGVSQESADKQYKSKYGF